MIHYKRNNQQLSPGQFFGLGMSTDKWAVIVKLLLSVTYRTLSEAGKKKIGPFSPLDCEE